MSKYSSSAHRTPPPPRNQVSPLVRGIGCLMMAIVPVFSWALAEYLIAGPARGWGLPPEWLGYPTIPPLLLSLSGLSGVWSFLQAQPALTGKIVFTVAIMIVLGGVMTIVYGYAYTLLGPSQYGPQDVPPPNVRTKKYKR